ncbi:aromatic amino acid hydroxylase [Chytridium lagenaria]|nr:aromatic amino acid hydroxylase [Chytridium lagenaria]
MPTIPSSLTQLVRGAVVSRAAVSRSVISRAVVEKAVQMNVPSLRVSSRLHSSSPKAHGYSSVTSFAPVHANATLENPNPPIHTTLYVSIADRIGSLDDLLSLIRILNISLTRIESRPSKTKGFYDFFIDFDAADPGMISEAVERVRMVASEVRVVSGDSGEMYGVPWFPRKIADLDTFAEKVLSFGEDLDADHPGFLDKVYRQRREEITTIAKTYRHGQPLPRIEYTEKEVETWGTVFNMLTGLYKTHACKEHRYVFPTYCTGWTIRPVMGLLSSRDFLNALAFRVFHSTQYIRHHSKPLYTPEPDICHELLGHVPLFCGFSQEIGLASLGASDEDLKKLATIYWFTVWACKEGNETKAFGAGLLSSYGELEYCLSNKPQTLPFTPEVTAVTPYPICEYQPVYFVAESFADMKEKVKEFADNLDRPFAPRYNALTQSIELLDNRDKVVRYVNLIKGDLARLATAVDKILA